MIIVPARPEDFPRLKEFLLPHEAECVQLCSYVRKNSENLFLIKKEKDDSTAGVIYAKGTLLHCIPSLTDCAAELTKVLSAFLCAHSVKCVNGTLTASEFLKSLVISSSQKTCTQTNRYKLMTLTNAASLAVPQSPLCNDDEIRRLANPKHDADLLFELQKAYIAEEVVPAGKHPEDLEIRIILKQILKNQICLALFSDGEPVAKANTNAIGWSCVQLGGIYTHPLYRRNGYALHLVHTLCQRILRTGRTVTLYVKEKNTAACGLYKKLGFTEYGDFEIAYFD